MVLDKHRFYDNDVILCYFIVLEMSVDRGILRTHQGKMRRLMSYT